MTGLFGLIGLLLALTALTAVLIALQGGEEWREPRRRVAMFVWLAYRLALPTKRGRRRAV